MKFLCGFLACVCLLLQYQLWLGEDGVRTLNGLELELQALTEERAAGSAA